MATKKFMLQGVSLSLPRKGVPGADLLLSVVSVPFTREHVCSNGRWVSLSFPPSGVPNATHLTSVSSVISVPFTREHVSSGWRYLQVFRAAIGASACSPKWSNEAVGSSHSEDLLETALLGLCPC